jgi:hypothetical protein
MLNLEMIGTDSKWGNNPRTSIGFEKIIYGAIFAKKIGCLQISLQIHIQSSNILPGSDNATLARLGFQHIPYLHQRRAQLSQS